LQVSTNERNDLLDELKSFTPRGIELRTLLSLTLIIAIIFLLLFPKIFLRNSIYYDSREIAVQERRNELLKEQNNNLRLKLQQMKFKNLVVDTIF